jgi:predicted phage terminase large subunit-like protein
VEIRFPEKTRFLFSPARYKVLYGGRGSAKSWSVARALLLLGGMRPLRILCTREIQNSIKDSVHKLLSDQILAMGLQGKYFVTHNEIRGINGTEFIFSGIRQQDISKIKSYEGVDICWVEEAHTVTKESWEILIPTIRKPGSEIWVTFNPDLESDDAYQRFVVIHPEGAVVVEMNYRDNPWFPPELDAERRQLLARDPDAYQNVWEGKTKNVAGDIFKREWFKFYAPGDLPEIWDEACLSWDMTFKDGAKNDNVCGQVWGRKGPSSYLLAQSLDKMAFTDTVVAFVRQVETHPFAIAKLVEDKANGPAVIDYLKKKIAGLIPVEPDGSKEARAHAITPYVRAGNVFLPDSARNPWVLLFLSEVCGFNGKPGRPDDQVDAMTQGLRYLYRNGSLEAWENLI